MRDLRDPQKLGAALLKFKTRPLSVAYDRYAIIVDDYPQDESMAKVTAREYRAELEVAAAAGDKYAQSRLETL